MRDQGSIRPCLRENRRKCYAIPSARSKAIQWTDEIDEQLRRLVSFYGIKQWTKIAEDLSRACPQLRKFQAKKCRERWINHLNPSLVKGEWSAEEDFYILKKQKEIGNRWSLIASGLHARTEHSVKNRWHSLIKQSPQLNRRGVMMSPAEEQVIKKEQELEQTEITSMIFWPPSFSQLGGTVILPFPYFMTPQTEPGYMKQPLFNMETQEQAQDWFFNNFTDHSKVLNI